MKCCFLVVILIISTGKVYPQKITGKTLDSLGRPVIGVSVTLETQDKLIVAYTQSNDNGAFELQFQVEADAQLIIQASLLGYKRETKVFDPGISEYNFLLSQSPILLDDVYVIDNQPRLQVRGDTITYKVTEFERPQDQVIGDVLKRLPGISVETNGKIFYNGKPISRFYIDGDNLLDDKYNIGTNSIPNSMVDKVEILENHEPIKMKRSSSLSTATALNITLREGASARPVNRIEAGLGTSKVYDAVLSNINLKSQYKALNQLWANSTGKDLSSELVSHDAFTANMKRGNSPIASLLSVVNPISPMIDPSRYLFNKTALINTNNLFKLKNEFQLKSKVNYIADSRLQEYNSQYEIFLKDSSIHYDENLSNKVKPGSLSIELNLNANKDKYYLDNTMRYERTAGINKANLVQQLVQQEQREENSLGHWSNEFTISQARKDGFWEFYSYQSVYNSKQKLGVFPPVAPVLFNNTDTLDQLIQTVRIPDFYSNNFISFQKTGLIRQLYKLGGSIENQKLDSRLTGRLYQTDQQVNIDSTSNDLVWNRSRIYAEGQFSYTSPSRRFSAHLTVPVNYQRTSYLSKPGAGKENIPGILINPSLFMKAQTGSESEINLNYRHETAQATPENVYTGYIMNNYRTFSSYGNFNQNNYETLRLGYIFRKTPAMLFFNINAFYTRNKANTIIGSIINSSYSISRSILSDNIAESVGINSRISKYLFSFKSTATIAYSWQSNKINQYINKNLLPVRMDTHTLSYGLDSKIYSRLSANYSGRYSINSFIPLINMDATERVVHNFSQQAELNWSASDFVTLGILFDHFYNSGQGMKHKSIYFMDWNLEYRPKKIKCIINLEATNIANVQQFTSASLGTNSSRINWTPLRGRIALLKVTFNL